MLHCSIVSLLTTSVPFLPMHVANVRAQDQSAGLDRLVRAAQSAKQGHFPLEGTRRCLCASPALTGSLRCNPTPQAPAHAQVATL